jgi:hypothetical protein
VLAESGAAVAATCGVSSTVPGCHHSLDSLDSLDDDLSSCPSSPSSPSSPLIRVI